MWHQVARKGGFSVGLAGWVVMVATLLPAGDVAAQRMSWLVEELAYRRSVDVPGGRETPEAVVADFYTHGQLKGDGSDLVVYARRSVVPFRILQIGPGDYCRVAFQPAAGQTLHQIYYGGQLRRPVEQPSWNPKHGLLMETRRWHNCNLNQLESVRGAFRAAEPIGADYVPTVFHRFNPFDVEPRPFLSRYVGTLRVPRAGKVEFYTASQDCSFLLIDGKLVVADPGRHRPRGRARHKGELELDLRPHRFEYYHAASGRETCMVAAWKLEGDRRPRPIPPTAFGSQWIARAPATRLEHKTERLLPDFRLAVLGDVPLPGDYPALVRTQLFDVSGKTVTLNAQLHWDFGDGQTSQEQNPTHIYLHPGPYQITLTVRRGASSKQIKNQVYVMRQVVLNKEQLEQGDKLADYLNILATYDPRKLDPPGLIQLVRVYLQVKQPERAALVGAAAFTDQAVAHTDATRWQILQLVGPLLRVQLNKPDMALEMYRRAGRMISRSDWRAICAIEAADILVNDLLKPAEAKPLLEFATASRKALGTVDASRLERVWGDWHALQGDGQAAATAYRKAQQLRQLSRSPTEQAAWRGAHSRSCESFLRDGALDRMRQELQKWENDFPADKLDGYLPYLQARYWAARKQFPQAIAVATQLLTVSPDSPYADRLLLLSAECEEKLGRTDRAAAAYQSLVTDYPGSPLVERARQRLDQLKGAGGTTGGSNSPNE